MALAEGWLYARGLTTAILVVKLDSVPRLCVRLAIQVGGRAPIARCQCNVSEQLAALLRQVFHCLADFEALADAVCQLQKESSATPASLKGLEVELANPQAIVMDHALFSLADLNSSAMFDSPRGRLRKCNFGKTMLVQHFSMNQTVLQFNSASYGQTPTIVNNARAQWEALSHANPSRWQVRRRAQPIRRYPPARGRSMPHGKERASGSGFRRRLRSSALPAHRLAWSQAARLYSQLQRVRARVADFLVADHDGLVRFTW